MFVRPSVCLPIYRLDKFDNLRLFSFSALSDSVLLHNPNKYLHFKKFHSKLKSLPGWGGGAVERNKQTNPPLATTALGLSQPTNSYCQRPSSVCAQ